MSGHTKWRLTLDLVESQCDETVDAWLISSDDGSMAEMCCPADIAEANARRLVACWNACEGVSTEELEAGLLPTADTPLHKRVMAERDELIEALRDLVEHQGHVAINSVGDVRKQGKLINAMEKARALLAKVGK